MVDHFLLHCAKTWVLWNLLFSLFGVSWILSCSVKETLLGWHGSFVGKACQKAWQAAPLCIFWTKERNLLAFGNKEFLLQRLKNSFLQAISNIAGKSKNKNQGLFYLYLEAVSIKNSKSQYISEDLQDSNADARATELLDLFSFSPRDLEFIVKFSEEHGSDRFRQILQSICPSIYGHELVKGELYHNISFMLNYLLKLCFNYFYVWFLHL
ncbi:putative DNA helicase MCM8 [Vitis vinifera]|uniref:Putative DNA helicase MCM8 n=1 Tax=Vitis vinifera TaxID=29760 RepID=A0A438IQ49_VITVI|nr:putative DNA helicase MCM8 [Vitis vinifera]